MASIQISGQRNSDETFLGMGAKIFPHYFLISIHDNMYLWFNYPSLRCANKNSILLTYYYCYLLIMSKRSSDTYFTPPNNTGKTRVLESTSNVSNIIQQLGQQFPDNTLVKQLQGAFEDHMQQIHSLLETVVNLETPEEKERKRSLVFIGLAESTEPKASDRVDADNKAVKEVLDLLDVGAPPSVVYRMGHPDPNRFPDRPRKGPRVLKVVMPSSCHQVVMPSARGALTHGRLITQV